MINLTIHCVKDKNELNHVLKIRREVFVNEQKVEPELEFDGLDTEATHILAHLGKTPIGCARIRMNRYAKLERIAILQRYRGQGFGKQLMKYLITYCKKKGYTDIRIHSQTHVSEFYRKVGFQDQGSPFFEAGIEHIEMHMTL